MHCCISVLGYTASIVLVNPVTPLMQAISISSTPRAFILFRTESQNFALPFSPIHIPRTSFCPSILISIAIYTASLIICPSLLTWKCIASTNTQPHRFLQVVLIAILEQQTIFYLLFCLWLCLSILNRKYP